MAKRTKIKTEKITDAIYHMKKSSPHLKSILQKCNFVINHLHLVSHKDFYLVGEGMNMIAMLKEISQRFEGRSIVRR